MKNVSFVEKFGFEPDESTDNELRVKTAPVLGCWLVQVKLLWGHLDIAKKRITTNTGVNRP
ncbi:hypothetical protein [Dyadobacter fanqingshengii]|uniref:Uncharacterized protein n=1 Tax=Dyadobacter fanqingshengii TaxID=2906443 RepID=A0A9X1P8T0_9BACT|nr:hypothetical protein [Dyadobacter fanqingshengii]MCF0040846.1 hypothetical protein [Dyadobacter fanqingshengii]USJ37421.1 hypothetical protein NFI81_06475 [Dyadobacter fanqingshengii]